MAYFVSPDIHVMDDCSCFFSAIINSCFALFDFFSKLVCKINIFSSTWPCSGATDRNLPVEPQE